MCHVVLLGICRKVVVVSFPFPPPFGCAQIALSVKYLISVVR